MEPITWPALHTDGPDAVASGHAELLRGERALLEQIVRDAPLEVVLGEMAEAMERLRPDVLVSVLVAEDDGRRLRHGAAPSLARFYNEAIDGITVGEGSVRAARRPIGGFRSSRSTSPPTPHGWTFGSWRPRRASRRVGRLRC